ncbi:MAG TPA: A24 family peptidase, partial [Gammaproteobacteria bacterium]|nr:A24 family peptidase [Gammaproteobacteria bacterium]
MLLPLTAIDFERNFLYDTLTLPLLWLGLTFNLDHVFTDLHSAVIGALAGYLSLWSVYHVFKWATGKEGLGRGDFKLLAALGAWLGWQMLPAIILLSAATGAVVGITLILIRRHERGVPIPYGPFLAAAGWIALLWGHQLTDAYLGLAGLP